MLPDSIGALISTGESESVEFKRSIPPAKVLARTLAAFANAQGGVLLLGVEERPATLAVGVDPDRAATAVERAADLLEPRPEVRISTATIDGATVVAAEVSAAGYLTIAPDGLFIRVGDLDRPFTPSEVLERLSVGGDQNPTPDAANLASAVARLTERLDTQGPLLESLTKANHWSRKLFWIVVGAAAAASARELLPLALG